MEAASSPIPLLLEGGTGMGKSATIQEAARLTGNQLIRFNMSSHITVDDLLGKTTLGLNPVTSKEEFAYVKQPFTKAYENGQWLLLDELNLAPDNVLQCIEGALDSGVLRLDASSSTIGGSLDVKMHQNFRLFAAQNPSTGMFKGKREILSATLLDR